jgi:hypothetical protein
MVGRAGGGATFATGVPPQTGTDVPPQITRLRDPMVDFVIGVIDTGIWSFGGQPHPYLEGHLTDSWTQNVDEQELFSVVEGHGTFVSGVILNQAPTAMIEMRRALDGPPGVSDQPVVEALHSMRRVDNLKLVNLSFFGDEVREPEEIKQALEDLFRDKPDLVVVAAAGNSGTSDPVFPAAFRFPRLISVGAVDETMFPRARPEPPAASLTQLPIPPIASFSNHGPTVDAYASGVGVIGPRFATRVGEGMDIDPRDDLGTPEPGWNRWGGTSFAAAAVTGLIARTMIEEKVDCRQALERVLTLRDPYPRVLESPPVAELSPAPLVPQPGVPPELWRPYIWTGHPDWR